MYAALTAATLSLTALTGAGSAVAAQDADAVGNAFASHCFSPFLTAESAQANIGPSGARIDFYDLRPFSSVAPSPAAGRALTSGTDRRCEVAFDGDHRQLGVFWLGTGLRNEGLLRKKADVPPDFAQHPDNFFVAAAQLNPKRVAVVQVGLRQGPNGQETYINVERLTPLDEVLK